MRHLYLSLMPEALIVSMLDPEDFGSYYAVGSERTNQSQAAFFELDPAYRDPYFPLDAAFARCVPHADGNPKRSVYASVYGVLAHIPLSVFGDLHLTTKDGRTLRTHRSAALPEDDISGSHLYLELAPVRPLVASTLAPRAFFNLLMGESLNLPAIAFVELKLGELASDPENGSVGDLPYDGIDHIRSCLSLVRQKEVASKVVDRLHAGIFPYRSLRNGVFVGNTKDGLAYYGIPPAAVLKETNYSWWRSAQL